MIKLKYLIFENINIDNIDKKYPLAGSVVDGREVLKNIDNLNSVGASFYNYTILPGIREVPMSDFNVSGKSYSVERTNRIERLAKEISISNKISPLIVVIENGGPYILEGSTRIESLYILGAKSFPVMVVIDEDSVVNENENENKKINIHRKTEENYNGILIAAKTHRQSSEPFGVTEKDLPYMENWPRRTKNNETYVVIVTATENGNLIGKSMLGWWGDEGMRGDSIFVAPKYRKRGIGNKMYDVAEKHTGTMAMPSTYQTPMGKRMWTGRMKNKF